MAELWQFICFQVCYTGIMQQQAGRQPWKRWQFNGVLFAFKCDILVS